MDTISCIREVVSNLNRELGHEGGDGKVSIENEDSKQKHMIEKQHAKVDTRICDSKDEMDAIRFPNNADVASSTVSQTPLPLRPPFSQSEAAIPAISSGSTQYSMEKERSKGMYVDGTNNCVEESEENAHLASEAKKGHQHRYSSDQNLINEVCERINIMQ